MAKTEQKTNEQLLEERWRRIRDAITLSRPDRVPVVPLGDAFAARFRGVPLADFCIKPELAYRTMIDAFTELGEIDGIQHSGFYVHSLSRIWLSRVRIPGRDLPEDDLWQVQETELMEQDDYERIQEDGWKDWLRRFLEEKIPESSDASFKEYARSLPESIAAWGGRGLPVLSPVTFTIPFEYFCGGRTMSRFLVDLHRIPDRVQAAMDAAMPDLLRNVEEVAKNPSIKGCWIGGWRSASEFLPPRLWQRFVLPYFHELIETAVRAGLFCILHFDSNWTRDLECLRELPKGRCVLSLDGSTDIFKAKEVLGDHMCLMGDVSAAKLSLGSPEQVNEYSRRLVSEIGPSGFILAQGCDIPPNARPENVRAMIDAAKA
jgi:hypothetical protein